MEKNKLRNSYDKISLAFNDYHKYEISTENYSSYLMQWKDAIRCCGNYNYEKKPAFQEYIINLYYFVNINIWFMKLYHILSILGF